MSNLKALTQPYGVILFASGVVAAPIVGTALVSSFSSLSGPNYYSSSQTTDNNYIAPVNKEIDEKLKACRKKMALKLAELAKEVRARAQKK